MESVDFIIPNRGGENIDFICQKINETFSDKYIVNIVVVSQCNDDAFMRGQLLNIGVKCSSGDYLCFIDNDIFFEEYIDLVSIYNNGNMFCLQPFNVIKQVSLTKNGDYKVLSSALKNKYGKGGVTFISRDNFHKSNGYSNLYIGYGCEDTDFNDRCNGIEDIENSICHIKHDRRTNDYHWNINKNIRKMCGLIDTNFDSYVYTKYDVKYSIMNDNVKKIGVNKIYTSDDFKYNDILNLHYVKH